LNDAETTVNARRRTIGRHGRKMHDGERRRRRSSSSPFVVEIVRRLSPTAHHPTATVKRCAVGEKTANDRAPWAKNARR